MIKNAVLIFIEQYIGVGKTKKQPQKRKQAVAVFQLFLLLSGLEKVFLLLYFKHTC